MYSFSNITNIPDTAGVYKITNTVTGRFYIGSSFNIKRRMKEHKKSRRNPMTALSMAITKHGIDSFAIEVLISLLPSSSRKDLYQLEQTLIDDMPSFRESYNMNKSAYGFMYDEEHWQKHREGRIPFYKPVKQYSLDGEFLREFQSLAEAESHGFNHSKISLCCNGKRRSAYGYQWAFTEDESPISSYSPQNKATRVVQVDKQTGETIAEFSSYYAAAKSVTGETDEVKIGRTGNKISLCCRGKRKSACGFGWKNK